MLRTRAGQMVPALMFLALAMEPFYATRFHVGPVPTTVLEVVLLLGIVAALVNGSTRPDWRNPYTLVAALLLIGAAAAAIASPDRREAAGAWKAYFAEPMLAGLVIAGACDSRRRARLFLAGLAVAGVLIAVAEFQAFFQSLARHNFSTVQGPKPFFLETPNAVALFLVPLVATALAISLFGNDRRERLAAALFASLGSAAVLMCLSRGGLLALAAAAILVAAFHPLRLRILGALTALGLLLVGASPTIRDRILVELDPGNPKNTVQLRLSLWRSTLNLLRAHPVFGGGLSGFRRSIDAYREPSFVERGVNYPHQVVLNFWSETGIFGLVAFGWLLVVAGREALAGLRSEPWVRALSIGLLAALVGILIHGLVDVPYFKNDLALEFWALLGIQLGARRAADPGQPQAR